MQKRRKLHREGDSPSLRKAPGLGVRTGMEILSGRHVNSAATGTGWPSISVRSVVPREIHRACGDVTLASHCLSCPREESSSRSARRPRAGSKAARRFTELEPTAVKPVRHLHDVATAGVSTINSFETTKPRSRVQRVACPPRAKLGFSGLAAVSLRVRLFCSNAGQSAKVPRDPRNALNSRFSRHEGPYTDSRQLAAPARLPTLRAGPRSSGPASRRRTS
jgi:hypothetical protein